MSQQASTHEQVPERGIDAGTMSRLVDQFFDSADARPWHRFHSFDWATLDPRCLTREQKAAVVFITFIEDHLPGYFQASQQLYPVNSSVSPEQFMINRELYRFSVKWAQEEDAHAHVLFRYQMQSGIAEADELRRRLTIEGRKPFTLAFHAPVQMFCYGLLQEKATQLYYQSLARAVEEPVLKSILTHMARDEARHYAFHASVVEEHVRLHGAAVLPDLLEVVDQFAMPLSGSLENYGLFMRRLDAAVGGFDALAFHDALLKAVRGGGQDRGPAYEALARRIERKQHGS